MGSDCFLGTGVLFEMRKPKLGNEIVVMLAYHCSCILSHKIEDDERRRFSVLSIHENGV